MTKQNYLDEFENCLQKMSLTQRKEILSDIEEYFEMSIKNGRDENEIIASLGFPSALARQYREEGADMSDSEAEENTSNINTFSTTDIENINVSIYSAHFCIVSERRNSDDIKVEISDKSGDAYRAYVEGGTLYIAEKEGSFPFRFFRDKDIKIKLYLPEHYRSNLSINMKSGKIEFEQLSCGRFDLKLMSGSVSGGGVTADNVTINVTSGNLSIARYVARAIAFTVMSGNIRADKIESPTLDINAASGTVNICEAATLSSNIKCSSGVFKIESMTGNLSAKATSGTMKINYNVLPEKIDVSTASGSVKISLPQGSVINLHKQHTSGHIACSVGISPDAACAVITKASSGIIKIY